MDAGSKVGSRMARIARRAAAFLVASLPLAASAGPAAGTTIPNQASAIAQTGGGPVASQSNLVTVTVGASSPAAPYAATLAPSHSTNAQAGASVTLSHVLRNTGTQPDTYTLAVANLPGGGWSYTASTLYADANADGQPDSATPLAGAVALAPGEAFRFVARYTVPAAAPSQSFGEALVGASSSGGAAITSVRDRVTIRPAGAGDCGTVTKVLSASRGPSPAGPVIVELRYAPCDQARTRIVLSDPLPAGMRYVAGSGRWSGTGEAPLSDAAAGNDFEGAGPTQVAYDYGVTTPGTVTATIVNVPAWANGAVRFSVEIAPGLALGAAVANTANFELQSATRPLVTGTAGPATYVVNGRGGFELAGARVASAQPGSTVSFDNVLKNTGDLADSYDVTLAGSTFPAGTTFALFQADGVTPLADTNGNGTPDTGVVAPGASYRIVLRARIPESAAPAAYKVTKVARSISMPAVTASADDVLDTVARQCAASLDPDNSAQVGYGQHVTYTHYLSNRGNCEESVRAMPGYLADSRPGWVSTVFVDNPVAGAGSLPGALDATDTPVVPGWIATLPPGHSLRVLVDVRAPTQEAMRATAAQGKALVDTNVTTLVIRSAASGDLTVRDTTVVDDKAGPGASQDTIRNYTDSSYAAPTLWGVVGGSLWLRADARSCNAVADAVESRVVLLSGPNGEREEVRATETSANSGIFVVPALAVRAPPVVAGDGVAQGGPDDVFEIEMLGCGRRVATVVTLMQPVSRVFDSRSGEPVSGARVTLLQAQGGRCASSAASVPGNPATTAADGRFAFPGTVPGDYCLSVAPPNGYHFPSQVPWPLLPAGHNLHVTGLASGGSYGGAFGLASALLAIDVPLDAAAQDGLFVRKEASRAVAEVGEFVDYTVRVRNATGNALDRAPVTLVDDLPAGFGYVRGSARRDGQSIAEPSGGSGPRLGFSLAALAAGEEAVINYRVRVGPGAMQGDGINRAQARYAANGASTLSNVASARVQVTGGVFTDKGFILGKVFLDCDANGLQDRGEIGVPGVRLLLEDGTYVVTDGGGKFSFYGIDNRTHVLKADRSTLPAGARLAASSARHLGDAGSRIVDLKSGELHRADFAIAGCESGLVERVKARIEAAGASDELSAMFGSQLATEARIVSDVKALPASGTVQAAPAAAVTSGASAAPQMPMATPVRPSPAPRLDAPAIRPVAPALVPLEDVVPSLDKELGFVNLADGQVVDFAQVAVRVKGAAGAAFTLKVNGVEVPASRIGKRAVLQDKQVQAWEFIGIELDPGPNTLELAQVDPFGNPRGSVSIRVVAPDKLGRVALELPAGSAIADGRTPVAIRVKLSDGRGTPVTVRTPVTLDTSIGRWKTADLDPAEPGLQVMVEGGEAIVELLPPPEPASTQLTAASGPFKADARLDFLPELRSLVGAGVLEGIVNLRNVKSGALAPARQSDGFERELRQLSREWGDGRGSAAARAAFYLKGKIKGEFLLTAAYDSDKDTKERLFRDIQPDEFYPIYGDSGVRGFDAQSTSKLYVRVDHRRSYLLWGDFTTQVSGEARKLSNYSRSLTGVKQHYENDRVSVNAFASRDTTRQVIEELRANGTSGPYALGTPGALENSEKVEIVTRDRNQPSIIVGSVAQSRFSDYEIEALTGRILFKSPVPSVDRDLNPVFVRITYEVDQGGDAFWVAGVDAQAKVTDRIEVGGVYVKDGNPLAPFSMAGANATVRLAQGTYLVGEAARTENGVESRKGDAARVELKHESTGLKAQAFVARTDREFENPGAYLAQGRGEAGGRLEYKLTPHTTLRGEALRTEDVATRSVRDGLAVAVQHQLHDRLTLELGVRHAVEKGIASPLPPVPAPGGGTLVPQPMPDEVTTVRARVTGSVPQVAGLSVFGEAEVDVQDADRRILAAGGEYELPNKGRVYARHEFVSSISGPYGLNATERQNTTAFGVDTEYMKDGRLFSEYRIRDAMAGGDVEAALGLKNLFSIAPGLRLGTTFERVESLAGTGQNENTALALALEYTGSPVWKGSTRLELRDSQATESLLFTVALAARLSRDWTALARNAYTVTRHKEGGEHVVDRMQAGLAFRDSDTNRWNALGRIEHRMEENDQSAVALKVATTIVSLHADWQPRRPFLVSGRYAAKWSTDRTNGLATKYRAQVAGVRGTWEFAPRWDVSLVASVQLGDSADSRQYGVGLEVGYLLATNLWVSGGYNVLGYRDADLAGADYTARGPFVRVRYKFDEALVEGNVEKAP